MREDQTISFLAQPLLFFTHYPFPVLCCLPVFSTRTSIFSLSSLPAPCLLTVGKTPLISLQQNKYVLLYSVFSIMHFCITPLSSYLFPVLFPLSVQHSSMYHLQSTDRSGIFLCQFGFCFGTMQSYGPVGYLTCSQEVSTTTKLQTEFSENIVRNYPDCHTGSFYFT